MINSEVLKCLVFIYLDKTKFVLAVAVFLRNASSIVPERLQIIKD